MACVYAILNWKTGRRYIGSTQRVPEARWKEHQVLLRRGKHNKKFQAAWDTYGPNVWEVQVLEYAGFATNAELLRSEQYYLDTFRSVERGYNDNPVAKGPNRGFLTAAHRTKIGAALKGKKKPASFRRAMSRIHKGKIVSAATREKMAAAKRGKKGHPHTAESRRLIAEANRRRESWRLLKNNRVRPPLG